MISDNQISTVTLLEASNRIGNTQQSLLDKFPLFKSVVNYIREVVTGMSQRIELAEHHISALTLKNKQLCEQVNDLEAFQFSYLEVIFMKCLTWRLIDFRRTTSVKVRYKNSRISRERKFTR